MYCVSRRTNVRSLFILMTSSMASFATMVTRPPRVLSIQSHTVHGYVGNKASSLPLNCLGFHSDTINTISLSNTPDYPGGSKGQSLSPDHLKEVIDGLAANNLLDYDILLTGYSRSLHVLEEIVKLVGKIKEKNPDLIYVCDPVLGDNGKFYVPHELADYYRTHVLPLASVIVPNHFEVEALSGLTVDSFQSAKRACEIFHKIGVKLCILTGIPLNPTAASDSLEDDEILENSLSVIASLQIDGSAHIMRIDIPKLGNRAFSGCGDLFAAVTSAFLHRHLDFGSSIAASSGKSDLKEPHFIDLEHTSQSIGCLLEHVTDIMNSVLRRTADSASKELCLIESVDTLVQAKYMSLKVLKSAPRLRHRRAYLAHGKVAGVIFDMDGTLTHPGAIDFEAMYRRTGLVRRPSDNLLSLVLLMEDTDAKREALRVIEEEEMLGCERMLLREDLPSVLQALDRSRVRVALSTRNCDKAVGKFLEMGSIEKNRFSPVLHRDSLAGINKPDPRVAQHIISVWDADPDRVWFVGDSEDDIKCGKAAGCKTCLVADDDSYKSKDWGSLVDFRVKTLEQFAKVIGIYDTKDI